MIRVSVRLGALAAQAETAQLEALDRYGRRIGLAFQIVDDVLDVCGEQSELGKRVGKDAGRGKLTFPGLLGIDGSLARARAAGRGGLPGPRAVRVTGRGPGGLGSVCPRKESIMDKLLPQIRSPQDLKSLSLAQLKQLAKEMREALCSLASLRTSHFASNLGVVELTLALHTTFDFSHDRLIWDTGHQIYAHKLVTGRFPAFHTMRAKGGLTGYPNPAESPYDLFLTGHAGCSISTALGLKCGDNLLQRDQRRQAVAVIGDGAFSSGVVFEAMNHAGGLKEKLTVVLNDNKMSICPRIGGLANYLDQLRMTHFYTGLKVEVQKLLTKVPVLGDPVERLLTQIRDGFKAGLLGGMLFEELGFRYIGPADGHNIAQLQKYLAMARDSENPVLVHVVTRKGQGFAPAEEDPTFFHTPAPFERRTARSSACSASARAPIRP